MEALSEEDKRALRGSKFAPLPSLPPSSQPRLAHPGGAIKTNKAAALAKFLERKLQEPNGLASIDPELVEVAVKNAKHSVSSGGASTSRRIVRHVDSFDDPRGYYDDGEIENTEVECSKKNKKMMNDKQKKRKKANKKNKQKKVVEDVGSTVIKKPKKKLKL